MKILIAGGGVGGLCAAVALALDGHCVRVFEQADEIGEVGAGVQLSPNGVAILERFGVMPGLESAVFEPEAIEMRIGAGGRQVFHLPMRGVAQKRWGARYLQVFRPDLIEALRLRFEALAPGGLNTGARVARYDQDASGVTVTLEDGAQFRGDVLIAADGVHSRLRAQMLGAPDAPIYTGNTAWRAVVPRARLGKNVPPPTGCIWIGDAKHAVTTRMRRGDLVNFVGIVETPDAQKHVTSHATPRGGPNAAPNATPNGEGWRILGTQAQARADFGGWHPVIDSIIDAAGEMFRWPLFGRAPLEKWSVGRVALLGDAAHPMLPSMAQGAVSAFEDAVVLARVLHPDALGQAPETGAITRGLCRYFAARIDRTTRVQQVSAENLTLFHGAKNPARWLAYGGAAFAGRAVPGLLYRRYDWLYGARV